MLENQNIATFRRVIGEGFNKGNLDALDDCFSPAYSEHQFDLPPTLEGFKGSIRYLRQTFNDFSLTIEDIIASEDMVWARMTGRGTNSQPFMGRPPTGKTFTMSVIDICRFEEGRIVEHWGIPDRFHLITQLGLLPQPPQSEMMAASIQTQPDLRPPLLVVAGEDRFGQQRGLGISSIDFKLTAVDSHGLLIIENSFREKGGPARHLHTKQDEWFFAVEGEFLFEIGPEKFTLKPGDSLFAPRNVPHVWACTGDAGGKILIAFMPAGKMEAFFREVTKANAMPAQDPELWHAHDMELLGPPLLGD